MNIDPGFAPFLWQIDEMLHHLQQNLKSMRFRHFSRWYHRRHFLRIGYYRSYRKWLPPLVLVRVGDQNSFSASGKDDSNADLSILWAWPSRRATSSCPAAGKSRAAAVMTMTRASYTPSLGNYGKKWDSPPPGLGRWSEIRFVTRSGKQICKFNFLVEVEKSADGRLEVKLDPSEHQRYVWASEEEVRVRMWSWSSP